MFALAANDITILAQDTVRVQVSIAIVSLDTVFENAGYYIPVNGVVHLGELGELANSCIQLAENFGRFGMEQSRNAYCTLTISLPDEEISSSSELWYCRKDLGGVLPPIPRFATALRNRRLSADQFFPNPFDTNNTAPLSGRERLCPIHMYNLPIVLPVLPRIRSTHF